MNDVILATIGIPVFTLNFSSPFQLSNITSLSLYCEFKLFILFCLNSFIFFVVVAYLSCDVEWM